jgi:hypothetical protein
MLASGLMCEQQLPTADRTRSALQSLACRASAQAGTLPAPGSVPIQLLREDAKVALAWRSEAHSRAPTIHSGASSLERRMEVTQVGLPLSGLHLQCVLAWCLLAGA